MTRSQRRTSRLHTSRDYTTGTGLPRSAESQRALALDPNLAIAHREYGNILWNTGRLDEATTETKRARDLDPLSLEYNLALGLNFYVARKYDQAIAQGLRILELDPNFIPGARPSKSCRSRGIEVSGFHKGNR